MSVYQTLNKIQSSVMKAIEKYSKHEELVIKVQIEECNYLYDSVVLIYDSNGLLLADEVYTVDIEDILSVEEDALVLKNIAKEWIKGCNVKVEERIQLAEFAS